MNVEERITRIESVLVLLIDNFMSYGQNIIDYSTYHHQLVEALKQLECEKIDREKEEQRETK